MPLDTTVFKQTVERPYRTPIAPAVHRPISATPALALQLQTAIAQIRQAIIACQMVLPSQIAIARVVPPQLQSVYALDSIIIPEGM